MDLSPPWHREVCATSLAAQANSSLLASQQLLVNRAAPSLGVGASQNQNWTTWSLKCQKLSEGEAGRGSSGFPSRVAQTNDAGADEEQQSVLPLCEQGWESLSTIARGKNPSAWFVCASFVFPTPAPFPLPFSPPTLQEDALGVGFDLAANALRRCVNDDWQLLKVLFQHLAVTTPHTSAA